MSTTASQALAAIRARLNASGIAIPMYWQGDDAPILPDDPAAFVYIVFNNEGSGRSPVAYGGGRGRNTYRNSALVEAYVFAPLGVAPGLTSVLEYAETIAAALRSFRNDEISCFSADVIPVGPGSSISPPGFASEVSSYQAAIAEIALQFDQVG